MRLLLVAPLSLPWHTSRFIIPSFQKYDWEVIGFDYRNPFSSEKEVNDKLFELKKLDFDLVLLLKGEVILPDVLKEFPCKKALWYFDMPIISRLIELGKVCDRFFLHMRNQALEDEYLKRGLKIYYLPQGVDPSAHSPCRFDPKFRSSIAFTGSFDKKREEILLKLSKKYRNLRIWGNGWECSKVEHAWQGKPIYLEGYGQVCASSKIVLNLGREGMWDVDISARIFMTAACKGFQLSNDIETLGNYFDREKEIAVFHDAKELSQKIKFYSSHSKERKKIIEAAYKRVLSEHSYDLRIKEMLKCLGL